MLTPVKETGLAGARLVARVQQAMHQIPKPPPEGPPVAENRDHFAYPLYQTRLRRSAAPSTTTLTFVGLKLLPAFGSCGQFAIVIESPPRSAG